MLPIHEIANAKHELIVTASGDSYTTTKFDPRKEQPSPNNPFGNPALPTSTSVDQKWIHYLTMGYNRSAIQTYNMADYGATVDGFVQFYHQRYMPYYSISNHTGAIGRNTTNSLFISFFGINDVAKCPSPSLMKDGCSEIFDSLFIIYRFLLEQVSNLPSAQASPPFFIIRVPIQFQ